MPFQVLPNLTNYLSLSNFVQYKDDQINDE